ncbi:CHY zinc finger domain-containing protein [Colletotrichum paranaense]|uniref:CHY zinc finger domain-containing protein n=1 Tax=Colletotrichum paranaense TaxID=1914294 RepID=A0ABQ9S4Y7_9PEZI|nr:CHY zinc finger domain-containing protein [Colletotrichum paranaense]KAK1526558.1 CHY zinc finger domain-containing protein [Colletotrichum paranaense]
MISLTKQGGNTHQQAVPRPRTDRVVPKPVPEAQSKDPRGYQLEQLRKRYSPRESTAADGTTTSLVFRIKPSDPDFPFELEHLQCDLRVPEDYPDAVPVLHVRNSDIPRGFCINIERGWERLVEERRGATLLALTYALDKNLEKFLSEQEVATVKLVTYKDEGVKDTRHLEAAAIAAIPGPATQITKTPSPAPAPPVRHYTPEEYFTKEEMAAAKARRAQETRQLETRMGRLSLYRRSPDGIVYTLPLEPRRRAELSPGLQGVKTVHLIVPLLYPLQPLRIQLNECDSQDAEPLEELYVHKAAEQKQMTLTSHLNYLAQNMHVLAKQAAAPPKTAAAAAQAVSAQEPEKDSKAKAPAVDDDDRSHIKVIPRPPEWSRPGAGEDNTDSSDSYDSEDDSDEGGADLDAEPPSLSSGLTPERGTSISFPTIELHSIELFQVSILNLSVKCSRCKTINEITGLKHEVPQTSTCRKCAAGLAAQFRQTLVHANSTRAGFVDLTGCTVSDMLPSTFIPVCAKCSTASQGLVAVRGDAVTNVCRACHGKFTFKIPTVKFLALSAGGLAAPTTGPLKKAEKLGLHAGTPLPDRGACAHYRKSYRWFRFSCCAKVHPCDRCHDEAENHVNEWANRMVCGWCSREQRYSPEACGFCGRSVIGRKGKGFWEGGKGTRDRKLMSRKDPRKFKRVGGGAAAAAKKD